MTARFLKDAVGWGVVLWVIGYVLGIVLFAFVPTTMIGWIITPFGAAITLWIAFRKIRGDTPTYYLLVGVVWLLIAVVGDYVCIVKAFNPPDGYYKADVYVYYTLTLAIPVLAGWMKSMPPTGSALPARARRT